MSVCRLDLVVLRTKVAFRGDEVDVVVGVIVLLKLDRVEAVTDERRGRWELLDQVRKI